MIIFILILVLIICAACPALGEDIMVNDDKNACPLVSFIPFNKGRDSFLDFNGNRGFSQMAAALLAVDDFNNRNGAVVAELESDPLYKNCSIYIPEDELQVSSSNEVPKFLLGETSKPCAIIGPYTNEETTQAAVFGAGWDIPVITHGAEDPRFSGKKQELVFRSVVDTHPLGEAVVNFLRSKGRTDFLGGIYISQDFGVFTQESIVNAAKESNFTRRIFQKVSPPLGDPESIYSVDYNLKILKETTFRTLFLVGYDNLEIITLAADAAEKYKMNRGDYVWMISLSNIVELDEIRMLAKHNTNVTKLLHGAGLLRLSEGFDYNPFLGEIDPFLQHWKSQDASFVDRLNALNPLKAEDAGYFQASANYFQTQYPLPGSGFIYDAVMMAAMGKCQQVNDAKSKPKGRNLSHDSSASQMKTSWFRKLQKKPKRNPHVEGILKLKFTGATGGFEFGKENDGRRWRNRHRELLTYSIYNFVEVNDEIQYRLSNIIRSGSVHGEVLELKDTPYIFADGTPTPPILLRDIPEQNYLKFSTQLFGIVVMSICLLLNLISATFVICYWERTTFRDAHPRLLLTILLGSTLVALSILGYSFDESYDFSKKGLDTMCASFPWLLGIGFITIYSPVLCKLLIYKKQSRGDKWHMIWNTISILLLVGTTITLIIWLSIDSRLWSRVIKDDLSGESVGFCVSNAGLQKFRIIFGVLLGAILIIAIHIAYNVKDLDERFAESRWIFISSFTQSQVFAIGVPILWQLSNSPSTSASLYLCRTIMISFICITTTVCLFGPKIYSILFPDAVAKMSDSVWKVNLSELDFGSPVEIIGRGTFGFVLKAEYRGTDVAVKRVIPPRTLMPQGKKNRLTSLFGNGEEIELNLLNKFQKESGAEEPGKISGTPTNATASMSSLSSFLGSSSFSLVSKSKKEYSQLKADFILEMRQLSKLRHPCITTVMGAVINRSEEPMLVMELMDHGSLYDLLHNETIFLEGEILLPILRDIAQGVRFLHAANPQVIHGDLKAANVLVDSKFRAKVADFGLSQKRQVGATGTPYWMAPELLNFDSNNTSESDMYSFGIILYEVYSRMDPYQGEDFNEVLKLVADPLVCKRPPVPKSCPDQVKAMMNECLQHDPRKRPTFAELDVRLRNLDVNTIEPAQFLFSFQEKKRTDQLLYDVFPQHIAEALRDGRKVDPESRDVVTIFFSDIVGFTNISSTLEPIKVSHMLDRLYQRFDEVSQKHDVFKVETIGDAYMAVTNLVKDQPDHAKIMAKFSIDITKAANETLIDADDVEKGYVNIRVGFHSGPVVANVVGSRNPRYCLFGDTVNTASRMESNSMKNRIHCSERAAQLLRNQDHDMPLKPRGTITVKGKGDMNTYWVNEGDQFCLEPTKELIKRRHSGMGLSVHNRTSNRAMNGEDILAKNGILEAV